MCVCWVLSKVFCSGLDTLRRLNDAKTALFRGSAETPGKEKESYEVFGIWLNLKALYTCFLVFVIAWQRAFSLP